MAGVLVGSAVLSGFFNVLLDRAATREFLNFLLPDEVINFEKLLWELKGLLWSADVLMDDAEEKRILEKRVDKWLTELKDVVFKAGEVVDKIETEALRLKMEGGQSTSLFSTHVKSELEEILSSLKFLLDRKEELGLQAAGRNRSSEVRTRLSERPIPFVSESEFCGREDIKETIMQSLRSAGVGGDKVSVIPIIGAGGLGKTTLVQMIYYHPEVKQLFEEFKAWVTVSTEFDLPTITKTIIRKVSSSSQINGDEDQRELMEKMRDALTGKKFLLVLDDVWSENHRVKWESLKSCFMSGSKIIVTTRSRKVASIMAPNQEPHSLPELPKDDCLKLFALTVFSDDQDPDAYPDLQEIGKKIVHKCKGNPLSVRSVGGILRGERHPEKWEKILESSMWELLKDDEVIIPSLMLSYLYLPSEIKPCFAYCSIFPEDYRFEKEEVVRLWMAEGFLKNEAGKPGITMEEVGKQYVEDLISRSLFQNGIFKETFSMHDLVHDLAVNVSGEFCFCLEGEKNLCDLSCKTRYLSNNMEILDVTKFEGLSKAKRLHSFVGLRRPLSLITPNKELDILKVLAEVSVEGACLRVLSLSQYYKIDSLCDSLGKLKHLRYLNLSHTDVRELPDSVCTLYNLQTLLLRDCRNLTQLPESIGNLKQLRYLDLSDSNVRELPDSVCTLYNLQTLLLRDCRNLTQLPESIGNLKQLRYLDLSDSNVRELPDSIGTLDNLQTLRLSRCRNLTLLPSNQGSLINLHHLDISNSPKLEFLGNCRYGSLKDLKIVECEALKWIPLDYFPKLNTLVLKELECLIELTGESADELKWLSIEECPKLEFTGNGHYGSLKDLKIKKCEALKSIPLDYFPKLNTLDLKKLKCLVELTGESANELKWLSIKECPKLEYAGNGRFGSLKDLKIKKCEALKSIPLDYFPTLNTLDLKELKCLVEITGESADELKWLSIEECPKLEYAGNGRYGSLKDLKIKKCEALKSIPLDYFPKLNMLDLKELKCLVEITGESADELKRLSIEECPKLEFLGNCRYPKSIPLDYFPKLTELTLRYCQNFESFRFAEEPPLVLESLCKLQLVGLPKFVSFPEGGLPAPNLKKFDIEGCENLRRLPQQMQKLLPSLKDLEVSNCGEIESWPEGGLPSNLKSLGIWECKKLVAQVMHCDLQVTCLKKLDIDGCGEELLDSFPPEGFLPTSLTSLSILNFRRLKTLNIHAFQHLKKLHVFGCDELQCLPEESLPNSLVRLLILDCPLLERRYRKETGEDWHKISHVPKVWIDGREQHSW